MFIGEWISGSVCMYLSHRLATPSPSDLTVSQWMCLYVPLQQVRMVGSDYKATSEGKLEETD